MPATRDNTTFDKRFIDAHAQYGLPFDWRLLKAQAIAESDLKPSAQSSVGARGLMQFMPATWAEVLERLKMPADTSPFDASASIKCGAFYMRSLITGWSAPRPEIDRYCLALASYNAGAGHVLNAQKLAGGSNVYGQIIAQLPKITGIDNARQTAIYVRRILDEWQAMILEG